MIVENWIAFLKKTLTRSNNVEKTTNTFCNNEDKKMKHLEEAIKEIKIELDVLREQLRDYIDNTNKKYAELAKVAGEGNVIAKEALRKVQLALDKVDNINRQIN